MKFLVSLSIILNAGFCFAQNKIVDSLFKILKTSKEDTGKVNVLINISKNYIYDGDLEKGKKSADDAMLLSKTLNYKKGIAVCYQIYGRERSERSDFNGSIDFYNKCLSILITINAKNELASVYGDLGNAYYLKGNLTKAVEYFLQALKIYELLNDKESIAGFSGNIGVIYENIHDNKKALSFYNKALKINQEINSPQGISINYISIGVVYSNLKKEDEALDYFLKSLKINEELGNNYYTWNALINISSSYEYKKDNINSLIYAKKALYISLKNDDVDMRIRTQHRLANIYMNLGETKLAEKYLMNNDSLLKTVSSLNLKTKNYLYLSDLYIKTGDYKKSMFYYKTAMTIKDSMLNDESNRKIIEQQAQFEFDKKSVADSIKVLEEKKITAIQLDQEKTQRYALYGGILLMIIFAGFMYNRFRVTNRQKHIIELKEQETKKQKHIIEEKQTEILDSINYAKRIQYSLLASNKLLNDNLPDHFLFFKPKDVVSGDFYWGVSTGSATNKKFILITADSTGHGVPGSIMSMLNISCLNEAVNADKLTEPADILNATRKKIINHLSNDGSAEGGKDGMDCSLVSFDFNNKKLAYATANNPIWIIRDNTLIALASDRMPVGKHDKDNVPFTQHEFDLQSGDMIYTITDGFPDQFGGPKGKKFKYKQLEELLISISHQAMEEQKQKLEEVFEKWKGDLEQVDDVCIIGVRFNL